jgi:hypothetical protein
LAGEEISLWSPGDDKDKVMTAKCEGILMVRSESTLEVESSLIEKRSQVHPPAEMDINRTAERRRKKARRQSQSGCEYKKRVTVAGKPTSRSGKLARLMRDIARRECTGDKVASRNQRGRKWKKRQCKGTQCNNGVQRRGLQQKLGSRTRIKEPDDILQMSLRIERTSDGVDIKHSRLQNEKRRAQSLMEERNMEKWTLWRGRPPHKWKKVQIKEEQEL